MGKSFKKSALLFLVLWSAAGFADFDAKMAKAAALFKSSYKGEFVSAKYKVAYRVFFDSKKTRSIVIFPGFGEASQKYQELAYDFYQRGYNVFILNHRGMGESQRLVATNSQIIHIDDAKLYISDAVRFLEEVVAPKTGENPVYLYGHSAGGLYGAQVMARKPAFFQKAVLDAPMFEMNLKGYSRTAAWIVGQFHWSTSYAPGSKDYDPKVQFSDQTAMASENRWKYMNATFQKDASLRVGGPSAGWVLAMMAVTSAAKIEALARQIPTPTLVFRAGVDTYVMDAGQDVFVRNAADAQLRTFSKAWHEIHQDVDSVRDEALDAIFEFFED